MSRFSRSYVVVAKDYFEEPRAEDTGPGPVAIPGALPHKVDAAHAADARFYARRKGGRPLGRDLLSRLPYDRLRALQPPHAVGGGSHFLVHRRGRKVLVRPRPPLYLRHRDSPPHEDALLQLLPLWPLSDRRRRRPGSLCRLSRLCPAPPALVSILVSTTPSTYLPVSSSGPRPPPSPWPWREAAQRSSLVVGLLERVYGEAF